MALAALNVIALGVGVWSIWHGVSFVDEGYLIADVRDPTTSVSLWVHFARAFLGWIDPGIVSLRAANLAFLGLTSLWFAIRAAAWLEAEGAIARHHRRSATAFILLGSHLRFVTFPLTLSYNTIVQGTILALITLILDARAASIRGHASGAARPFLTGALIAVAGFVKAPTVLLLGPMILAAWIFAVCADRRSSLRCVGAMMLGGILAVSLVFAAFVSPQEWIDVIVRVVPQFAKTDPEHALPRIVARFAAEVPESVITVSVHYRWMLLPGLAALVMLRVCLATGAGSRARAMALPIAVAVTSLFVARVIHMGHHAAPLRGVVQPYLAVLILAAAASLLRRSPETASQCVGDRRRFAALTVILLASPLAGLFGSNRHWMTYWPLYATPWFVVLLVAVPACLRGFGLRHRALAGTLVLGATATSQSVLGVLVAPMGMHEPRWRQTEVLTGCGALDGIRVDARTHAYLTAIRNAGAPTPSDGTQSIGLFALEVEQLAMGRRAWGGAWTLFYLSDPEELAASMRLLATKPPPDALVLIHDRGSRGGDARVLKELGLPFPEGYEHRATLVHPWTLRSVEVYAPRR